jgi:hypothetical protein
VPVYGHGDLDLETILQKFKGGKTCDLKL